MIRTIIVEDEENVKISTEVKLKQYCSDVEIIGWSESVAVAIKMIPSLKPDLVFMDIKLADGTGFDILKHLSPISFNVIFITAFNQFAIEAFKFSAIDYLLKPISPNDLIGAVNKIKAKSSVQNIENHLNALYKNLESSSTSEKRLVLNSAECIRIVGVSEVVYCQADINYTRFFLTDNSSIIIAKSLKEYEDFLSDYGFFRCHKSYIINIKHLKSLNKLTLELKMSNGSIVVLSQRRKEFLLSALDNL